MVHPSSNSTSSPVATHSNPTLYIHFDPDICHTVGFHQALSLPDEGPLIDPTDECLVSRHETKRTKTAYTFFSVQHTALYEIFQACTMV